MFGGIPCAPLRQPYDRKARREALNTKYEKATILPVHDRFPRQIPFKDPIFACFGIILTPWLTRSWITVELAKSRRVKIIFADRTVDLDYHVLDMIGNDFAGRSTTQAIKTLRNNRISSIQDLVSALSPRYTSWQKDRAAIAGLLSSVPIPDVTANTFQSDTYKGILRELRTIPHRYLFRGSTAMPRGFGWCPTSIFQFPQLDEDQSVMEESYLSIMDNGDLVGSRDVVSPDGLREDICVLGPFSQTGSGKLRNALQKRTGDTAFYSYHPIRAHRDRKLQELS